MHRHQRLDPSSRSISRPRFLLIGVILPNTLCAAVAPIATTSSRLDGGELALVPLPARPDLRRGRLLVQADFSARHEFEMLHRIGDVDLARGRCRLPPARGRASARLVPTKGLPARSSLSPGCSPTSMICARLRALAEHGLGRVLPERAGAARGGFLTQRLEFRRLRLGLRFIGGSNRFWALCGSLGIACDHRAGEARRVLDQGSNDRRLGQVPPVLLRHFRLHRLHLQPGRIEDAGVVAPPNSSSRSSVGASDFATPGVKETR